jgi:hemerythrin-like metal-binding protein
MTKLVLEDDMKVNIGKFNDQHVQWIDLTNQLVDIIERGDSLDEVEIILGKLLEFAIFHFKEEEDLLDSNDYPYLDFHKLEHQLYISKIKEYMKIIRNNSSFSSLDLDSFMKSWVISHIKQADKGYSNYLTEKGIFE